MISPRVPINDPCPCGSGSKYRNCCWKKEKREYAAGRSAVDRAIRGVVEMLESEWRTDLKETTGAILFDLISEYEPDLVYRTMERVLAFVSLCVTETCACDVQLEDGNTGIDLYLQKHRDSLHPMALEFLENWRETAVSLYEVQSVDYRKSLDLRDMLSRKKMKVFDSKLAEHAEKYMTFFARVVPAGGEHLLGTSLLPVDPLQADWIVEDMRDRKYTTPGCTSITWKKYLKKHWYLVPGEWLEEQIRMSMPPAMHNTDGDPISALRITYTLRPGSAFRVNALLAGIEGMERISPNAFKYVVEASEQNRTCMENVVMAILELSGDTLQVEVNSENRGDRMTDLLKERFGEFITGIDREPVPFDPEATGRHLQPDGDIPPEELERIRMEYLDSYYRKWVDEPVPALDGLTPRQASKKDRSRKRLINLLREMESRPDPGGEPYDFGWIREELGLER